MTETLNTLRAAQTELVNAELAKDAAWKVYSEIVDDCQRGFATHRSVDLRYAAAIMLDTRVSVLWHAVENAKAAHLEYLASQDEDCTCTPISTCETCAQRARNSEIEF